MKDYDNFKLRAAIKVWLKSIGRDDSLIRINDMLEFGQIIGHPHNPYHEHQKIIDTNNPEVRRIIDLINGENGKTIVKVLVARNARS